MLKKSRFVMMILVAALVLSACLPATGSDGATIDATQAAQMVEDAVNKALDAQATQNAAAAPAATATLPPATFTAIPAPATETPVPTVTAIVLAPTATSAPASGGGIYTTPKQYCTFVNGSLRPKENETFAAGDNFAIKITLVNSGTESWPAKLDFDYYGGTDFTNGGNTLVELPAIAPGESVQLGPFGAEAPAKSGHYVMTFKVRGLDNLECLPYIAINVK